MNLDSRLFSLPNRDDLIASFSKEPKKFLGSIQLWAIDSLPVSVAPSGDARIFANGVWSSFDSWELLSEGVPLSFFLFSRRWPGLIAEEEYLLSFRKNELQPSSIEAELKNTLTAANVAIIWLLADYDSAERAEVYNLFKQQLEERAEHLRQQKREGELQGHALVASWGSKLMKQQSAGSLALLYLQLEICRQLDRRPIRLSPLVEVLHSLLNETRNVFNERMRVETDVLRAADRSRIRIEWNEFTYQTSRKVVAEAVNHARGDELKLLAGYDYLIYSEYLSPANKEFEVYKRRIRRLRLWTRLKSVFGLVPPSGDRANS